MASYLINVKFFNLIVCPKASQIKCANYLINCLTSSYSRNITTCLPKSMSNKSISLDRQVKVMHKLLKVKPKKKKKTISNNHGKSPSQLVINDVPQTASLFTSFVPASCTERRRNNVLHKLFMDRITEIMAMDSLKESLVGYGIEITNLKVSSNFSHINIYWIVPNKSLSETVRIKLSSAAGQIRSILTSFNIMGQVPCINFIEDKTYAKLAQLETVLQNADFGPNYTRSPSMTLIPTDNEVKEEEPLEYKVLKRIREKDLKNQLFSDQPSGMEYPENMRQDILGLNHNMLMADVLIKTKKRCAALDKINNYDKFEITATPDEDNDSNNRQAIMNSFIRSRKFKKESKKTTELKLWSEMDREEQFERQTKELNELFFEDYDENNESVEEDYEENEDN